MRVFSAEYLRDVGLRAFIACGAPADEAKIVADHLVTANLLGMDSHGIIRVPQYVSDVRAGAITPGTPIRIVQETDTTAVVDGDWNFGQVVALRATELAIEKAKRHAIGCVVLRKCRHVGCLGFYPMEAAKRDCVSLAACGSAGEGLRACPWGGKEGRLATNPIAFAAPTNDDPILLDFATSAASEGKVRVMMNRGDRLPDGWIVDCNGRPSNDPSDLYGPPAGAILPMGGSQGYKGFALSIMAQILGGLLGPPAWREPGLDACANVMWLMCIDVAAFSSPGIFRSEVDDLVKHMKSSRLAEGASEIVVPGELNFREMRKRQADGISIDDETWAQIEQTARDLEITLPTAEHSEVH